MIFRIRLRVFLLLVLLSSAALNAVENKVQLKVIRVIRGKLAVLPVSNVLPNVERKQSLANERLTYSKSSNFTLQHSQ